MCDCRDVNVYIQANSTIKVRGWNVINEIIPITIECESCEENETVMCSAGIIYNIAD